jgi:hypothetical protein
MGISKSLNFKLEKLTQPKNHLNYRQVINLAMVVYLKAALVQFLPTTDYSKLL